MILLLLFFIRIAFGKHIAVFDCGSSGTRVLLVNYTDPEDVYSFKQFSPNWDSYWQCDNRTRKMITPESKLALTKDIHRILIIEGIDHLIPEKERNEVPLLFYHTAGMRELNEEVQNEINDYLYSYMKKNTKYDVRRENFKVLTGWEESMYQWLSVNQNMKFIDSKSTMPILDMGGESIQFGLELNKQPNDNFLRSFVYTIKIDGKNHYVFLYSWMKYGTGSLADLSHVDRVNKGIMNSPCMYVGGEYSIEIHSKEYPDGGHYYSLDGTGNFDECADLMRPIFTETKDRSKCHGFQPMVSDYLKDNCIPFPGNFDQLYGSSCVGDALRYLKIEGKDLDEPLTFYQLVDLNREYAKSSYIDVLEENDGDENAGWTLSNAAMVSEFMKKAFPYDGLNNIKLYYNDVFDEKLQTWNLGAAIAYGSNGFEIIVPDAYNDSWFTTVRIALIAGGCALFVGLIIGLIIFLVLRKKKKNDYEPIGELVNDQIE